MRTLLVDADSFLYAAATTSETKVSWEEGQDSYYADSGKAKSRLDADLKSLQSRLKADVMVLALTDTENFRKTILPSYKENRKHLRKPMLLGELKAYCQEKYHTFIRPGLEADDVVGILATCEKPPEPIVGERVIVSIDKDLQTVPGLHWHESLYRALIVTTDGADWRHMFQTLTGDVVDGFKGCPGIGYKKAAKLLDGLNTIYEMWPKVVEAYQKVGLTEADALTQARVARILRASDYDFKERKVKLWEPPKQ